MSQEINVNMSINVSDPAQRNALRAFLNALDGSDQQNGVSTPETKETPAKRTRTPKKDVKTDDTKSETVTTTEIPTFSVQTDTMQPTVSIQTLHSDTPPLHSESVNPAFVNTNTNFAPPVQTQPQGVQGSPDVSPNGITRQQLNALVSSKAQAHKDAIFEILKAVNAPSMVSLTPDKFDYVFAAVSSLSEPSPLPF